MPRKTLDILAVKAGVIVHPVNCSGTISSGFSKQLINKYPAVLKDYLSKSSNRSPFKILGKSSPVQISKQLSVANAYCQVSSNGQSKFEYLAFKSCLEQIKQEMPEAHFYFPYKLGCGLQGGNWKDIESLIHSIISNYTICILPPTNAKQTQTHR